MKFRQKRPTQPGYYYALPVSYDELTVVLVRFESYGMRIDCPFDAGCEFSDHDEAKDFLLWGGPIKIPKFTPPKRLIYAEKPVVEKLPPSCRRWDHKFETYEMPEPTSNLAKSYNIYKTLLMCELKYEKCRRCGKVTSYNPNPISFYDSMFSTSYFTDEPMKGMSSARTATSSFGDFGITVTKDLRIEDLVKEGTETE